MLLKRLLRYCQCMFITVDIFQVISAVSNLTNLILFNQFILNDPGTQLESDLIPKGQDR